MNLLILIGLVAIIVILSQTKDAICQKLDEISLNISRDLSGWKEKPGSIFVPGQMPQNPVQVQNKNPDEIQAGNQSTAQNTTPEPSAKPSAEPSAKPSAELKPESILQPNFELKSDFRPGSALGQKSEAAGQEPVAEPKAGLMWKPFPMQTGPKPASNASPAWNWFWYGQEELEPDANREFLAASNWLIRFGMLVLVLGLGFFVKYSIDRGWMEPEIRILGTTLLGLGMYAAGIRVWHTKMNLLGQALMAGSACVLYFSAFGATGLYHLIPREMGFGWCIAITLLLVITALRWNSRLVGVLGTLGAYLTPVLFPFIQDDQVALILYLALLALGILAIRRFREWVLPLWIAFAGTFALLSQVAVSSVDAGKPDFLWNSQVLLVSTLFFMGVFHLAAQRRVRDLVTSAPRSVLALAALNGVLFLWFFFTETLNLLPSIPVKLYGLPELNAQMAWIGIPAVAYLLAAFLLKKTPENRTFQALNYLLAFYAFILGFSNILNFNVIVPSVLLLLCVPFHGACQKVPNDAAVQIVRMFGSLLAICILFATVFCPGYMLEDPRFFDRFLRAFLPGVSLYFLATSAYGAWDSQTLKKSRESTRFFGMMATLQLFAWLTIETWVSVGRYLPSLRVGALSIAWTLFALRLLLYGLKRKVWALRLAALGLFAVTIWKIFFIDLAALEQIYRICAFVALGLLILAGGVIYLRCEMMKKVRS